MTPPPAPLIVALGESRALGTQLAQYTGLALVPLEERNFEEGEFKIRPLTSVRERTVFLVQSLAGSSDASVSRRTMRLLFTSFGLRDAGAARVVAVVPYMAHARKDRRTQPRDPVNSRYIAQLMETAGVGRLVALDVHNPAALDNAFRIPVDHLSATPMFVDRLASQWPDAPFAVVSPDIGGVKRAQIFCELLQARLGRAVDLAFVEKRRVAGTVSGGRVIGAVDGRAAIVLDDLCASGGTLIRAAQNLREAGATSVHAIITHTPTADGLRALAACESISHILCTDSVGAALAAEASARMTVLPVAPLLGETIKRMTAGLPVTPLLQQWPPPRTE